MNPSALPTLAAIFVTATLVPFAEGPTAGRAADARATERIDAPTWNEDVRPILSEHCFACHGPDEGARKAGIRLDTRAGLIGDGEGSGPVVPGNPDDSELLYRVVCDDEFDLMPPPDAGSRLSEAKVDVLRRWIAAGAKYETHWAYTRFRDVVVPEGQDVLPIDAFISARLEDEGLKLSAPADARDLLRRVHLDLTGLPPTEPEQAAFLEDPSEEAYAARVDDLLSRTTYGEHWARQWLDAARYADSHGYTIDGGRSIWPWRDWVVQSIARDQSFAEFTVEQLAGDLLPGATRDQRIATGFHRNTQVNQEGGAKDEENRINAVIDRVATTGSVWLGSTIACAQCHTHKFDPITHTEYFGLFAAFNSTADGGVSSAPSILVPRSPAELRSAEEWEEQLAGLSKDYRAAWAKASVGWTVWQPASATGSNGPELRPEEDGSYRVLGQSPVYSTYVLEGPAPDVEESSAVATSLRLEVLPDGGPGRARNRNFVLQGIRVESRPVRREMGEMPAWTSVELVSARADFEQDTTDEGGKHYAVQSVLDEGGNGWAIKPQFNQPHVAEFSFKEPLKLDGVELRVLLTQEVGGNHTLGAFRALLGANPSTGDLVPAAWVAAWQALGAHRRMRPKLPSTLVLEERERPRETRRFERGSFLDQREIVAPQVPAAFDHFSAEGERITNRLDFARWLVHPENALVHRVTVNRWWQALFGRGLVETENDFGLRGGRPSHPDLLEWLAQDYAANGFSRRHVLRTIVLSKTYRQATNTSDFLWFKDGQNVLLGQQRRLPLTGEAVRDAMLQVSGKLHASIGGPPVQPPQPDGVFSFTQNKKSWTPSAAGDRYRRSLYTRIWRSSPYPFYATHDAPAANIACTRRHRSQSPLQALTLANDPMVLELCEAFGKRIGSDLAGESDEERIQSAFQWALGRPAEEAEVKSLLKYLAAQRVQGGDIDQWTAVARVMFNLGEFVYRP